jgi:hypothetical protein
MIDYTRPWHVLDIDISNAIRLEFDFDQQLKKSNAVNESIFLWNFADDSLTDLFSSQWLGYIKSLGFEIRNALLFYRAPNYIHQLAHIDYVGTANPVPAIYALNFVINDDDDSCMVWFSRKKQSGIMHTDADYSNPQNHYEFWPMDQLEGCEIDRRCIGRHLTLISTGTVHNIIMGKKPRWAVSIRLVRNDQINNWTDAVNCFAPWIEHKGKIDD